MTEEPPTVDVGMGMDPQHDVPGRVSQSAGPPAPGLCADAPADAAGLDRTQVGCVWAFPKEAAAKPDFDPSYALEFWDLTNRQDWPPASRCSGVRSPHARPGPLAPDEDGVYQFVTPVARVYAGEA